MAANRITVQVRNFTKLREDVEGITEAGRKALKNTVGDMKARAPGWIAGVVTGVYNIKKAEITPSKTAKKKKLAGSIRIKGETVDSLTITYEGRMLTPSHFGMTPKTPPAGKKYTLKQQVLKGKKQTIGRYLPTRTPHGPYSQRSHNILMGTGNQKEGGVNAIPFQRMSTNRLDLHKFTTISMPQMVSSERTVPEIQKKLGTGLEERFRHHMKRQGLG